MTEVVTGGAGFIGSHLAHALGLRGAVTVVDDLSSGRRTNLPAGIPLEVADISNESVLDRILPGAARVWHLAADPDVRGGIADPHGHAQRHLVPTFALLEGMRRHDVGHIVFTSTSTVYGEATVRPTPEDYGPLLPVSVYGGAKLACEALVSAWCGTYGMRAQLARFANVVGPRAAHGVTLDFVRKLRKDQKSLEILGDGTQTKSYVHVEDTVAGLLALANMGDPGCTPWNIGSLDAIPVTRVAEVVAEVMGLHPEHHIAGAAGEGGWAGDVRRMGLAIDRLTATGWEPKYSSEQAVRDAARWAAENA